MSDMDHAEQYASAAERHYFDGDFLHGDGRLPNADYHFGFAVECALKSLMLRYLGATMGPKPNGKFAKGPWSLGEDGKAQEYSHMPKFIDGIRLLAEGRAGARLTTALDALSAFDRWSVDQRYLDGSDADPTTVESRRAVAYDIIDLHQLALLGERLP
ncbi:hypothetical protein [Streptomyces zaomyceticus]|uniref:hypothetical protein n=1 Tax=Streptomyces zaomyceticus TaxID=68286 RepID=UPI00341AC8D4